MFNKGKDILFSTMAGRSGEEKASIIRGIMGSGESVPLLGEEILMAKSALQSIANVGGTSVSPVPISKLFGPGRLNAEDEYLGMKNLEDRLGWVPNVEPSRMINSGTIFKGTNASINIGMSTVESPKLKCKAVETIEISQDTKISIPDAIRIKVK